MPPKEPQKGHTGCGEDGEWNGLLAAVRPEKWLETWHSQLVAGAFLHVQTLDLSGLALRTMPNDDWNRLMPCLLHLNVSNNGLSQLSINLPARLSSLSLQNNVLEDIPSSVFRLAQLQKLSVGGNRLTRLNGEFHQLKSLKMLYAGCNHISEVDQDLGALEHVLEVLYLGGNRLQAFPEVITNLSSVKVLSLSDNYVASIPASVAKMTALQVLHLHRNELRALPVELLALRQLRQLTVRENPFVSDFADSQATTVPRLLELAARGCSRVMAREPQLRAQWQALLPVSLYRSIEAAKSCSSCGCLCFGDASTTRVEFLDLCGQYQVPFMRFICSAVCPVEAEEGVNPTDRAMRLARLRKVVLDQYNQDAPTTIDELRREILQMEAEESDWGV